MVLAHDAALKIQSFFEGSKQKEHLKQSKLLFKHLSYKEYFR